MGENASFPTFFSESIDGGLLALDGPVLSLNDGHQIGTVAVCFLSDTHYEIIGIDPTDSIDDLHHNIVARGISTRYDILNRSPWHTYLLAKVAMV